MERPEVYTDRMSEGADQAQSLPPRKLSDDPYGLPFEPLDEFSDAPLEFEELAESLWDILTDTYILSTRYNRRSPGYLTLCDHLERNIKQMGSLCVTKAVLEQKDYTVPRLEAMSVAELYAMVSLHFRKCYTAFRELREEGTGLDMLLMDRVCRWGLLAEKLKATENRIREIRSGRISADKLLEEARTFRMEPRGERPPQDPKAMRNPASLPLMRSYAADLVRRKKLAERQKAREERAKERESNRSYAYGIRPIPPAPLPHDAESMRKFLITKAKREKNQELLQRAEAATQEELLQALQRFWTKPDPGKKPEKEPSPPPRTGPSDEVRKKLREKRKKRKK